jgi:hypothetical protein
MEAAAPQPMTAARSEVPQPRRVPSSRSEIAVVKTAIAMAAGMPTTTSGTCPASMTAAELMTNHLTTVRADW